MVLRLWVPLSHWLLARNWNCAASGAALTASRVANRVVVSTPLRVDSLTVAVMVVLRCVGTAQEAQVCGVHQVWCSQSVTGLPNAWNGSGGQLRGLGVEGLAELLLQLH